MRTAARLVMGYYPLPVVEAVRLRRLLVFPAGGFSAVDPCVGAGTAFNTLLGDIPGHRYGIELDAFRAAEACRHGINVVQGDALQVRSPAESVSLLYLNPPYDFEVGQIENRRFELLFLEHTLRWLKRRGILVFIIPQRQLENCSRPLAEYFTNVRVYRLTAPESVRYRQVAVLGVRRPHNESFSDKDYQHAVGQIKQLANSNDISPLGDAEAPRYEIPTSAHATFVSRGVPLDAVEDLVPSSDAYLQVSRFLLRQPSQICGRPITPLHKGHVGLVATSGLLNGVFGQGQDRHIANWRPAKASQSSEEEEEDGTLVRRQWESFSHKLALLFVDGATAILGHKKSATEEKDEDRGQQELTVRLASKPSAPSRDRGTPRTRRIRLQPD